MTRNDEYEQQRQAEIARGRQRHLVNERALQITQWEARGQLRVVNKSKRHARLEYYVGGELVASKVWGAEITEELIAQIALAIMAIGSEPRLVQSTERDHSYREKHIAPSVQARYGKLMESN